MPVLANTRHELFAQERAQGRTVDEAYQLAGFKPNRGNAARLNANESVAARIAELQAAAAERAEITVADVLRELVAIGTADANDLVEYRVGCCRYCWGKANRRQETQGEREARYATWLKAAADAVDTDREEDPEFLAFDERGGLGFNAKRPPNADCPECFGDGVGQVLVKDTRQLTGAARALYGGMKVTQAGVQVVMHDKVGALTKVGQHLGMFVERRIHTDVSIEDFLAQLDAADADGGAAGETEASEG